jgi:hypothetical protein
MYMLAEAYNPNRITVTAGIASDHASSGVPEAEFHRRLRSSDVPAEVGE